LNQGGRKRMVDGGGSIERLVEIKSGYIGETPERAIPREDMMKENMTQQEKMAYMAGIIDGEGYIGILACGPQKGENVTNFKVRLCITSTSVELMDWLTENFGGNYYTKVPKSQKHKVGYTWQLNCSQAGRVIESVRPYLIIKRKNADLLVAYRRLQECKVKTHVGEFKFPYSLRTEIKSCINRLNQRGPVTTNTPDVKVLVTKIESELKRNLERQFHEEQSAR